MSILKFLSREKLVEYLDEELRLFLNDKEVYEINQYGWQTDNRPDPEYLGLAMWQTEPPTDAHTEDPTFPQARTQAILKNGREFEDLMKSARHSIGLSHLYHKNPDGMSPCSGYHFSDTAMKLSIAADRLRELFIVAFGTKNTPIALSGTPTQQLRMFCRPFMQTRNKLSGKRDQNNELFTCLTELLPLVDRVNFYRNSPKFALHRKIDIGNLIDWYRLMIDTSNKIFLAEYLLRSSTDTFEFTDIVQNQ